jgi:adenylate kinase family enzyme
MRAKDRGLQGARRILLHGVTGAGKSTLAARLSEVTGIGWTEADSIGWRPGWVHAPLEEQRREVAALCAQDAWILDSAWSAWADLVLPRTELVVALDHPRGLSLARLLRRTVARNLDGREICNGNVETWRTMVSSDSILAWHFRSFAAKRARLEAWEADPELPPVRRIRGRAEVEHWLDEVRTGVRETV